MNDLTFHVLTFDETPCVRWMLVCGYCGVAFWIADEAQKCPRCKWLNNPPNTPRWRRVPPEAGP